MNGDVLTNEIVIANRQAAALAPEFYVLRFTAQGGVFENPVPLAYGSVALDDGVGPDFTAVSNLHSVLNDCIRTNLDIGSDFGLWANDSGGVDAHGAETVDSFCPKVNRNL